MKHEDYAAQIPDYVLGLLPPRRIAELEGHLGSCKICQGTVARERSVGRMIHAALDAATSPDPSRLRQLMPPTPRARSRRNVHCGWRSQLQPALMLLLLLLGGLTINGLFNTSDVPGLVATAHAATATSTTTPTATMDHAAGEMQNKESWATWSAKDRVAVLPAAPSLAGSRPAETPDPQPTPPAAIRRGAEQRY